ncbi:hypothetical protein CBS63078_4790 [Aspergillus niger]|uniref:Uncharacterized protein n=3 Tax=Aspergillus TaxID=5052 RepID=A0A370PMH8_ASPPH|nr:hypothetical protein ASPNIDRAFT_46390 [Aspergillus niger ATCC 1015]KAI2832464.1 hypothetical protein CBS133816_1551 [Aspergillus niger]RDK43388.1 hypothetical protein M752DRAFT_335199 [Aspergillus phoenicis ATCC 13157]KAI2855296.1 hypothetical protein CBS12448_7331 [Aspergillus niger]KAI2871848.1 hypothetical protein CBS13152_10022 [Aspergillus niger]
MPSPSFTLANHTPHLIIQPSDAALSPPESYLFVQDGLIISCGILYAFCYIFCMIRTYSDRTYPSASVKGIQFMSLTLAYELFYAVMTTTTTFELLAFLAWFLLDVGFVAVAIWRAHEKRDRAWLVRRIVGFVLAGVGVLKGLTMLWPDEREQVTAYWTGILLQLPIGWICLATLWKEWDTRGHSLEIWLMRYLGCYTAYGVFFWRYWNVPQNWEYVASVWSTGIILWTLLPETVYPFVYVWVHRTSKVKGE